MRFAVGLSRKMEGVKESNSFCPVLNRTRVDSSVDFRRINTNDRIFV